MGKGYDTWCPVGPVLMSPSVIGDPQKLKITTTVNGVLKQSSNTSEMVQSIVSPFSFSLRYQDTDFLYWIT